MLETPQIQSNGCWNSITVALHWANSQSQITNVTPRVTEALLRRPSVCSWALRFTGEILNMCYSGSLNFQAWPYNPANSVFSFQNQASSNVPLAFALSLPFSQIMWSVESQREEGALISKQPSHLCRLPPVLSTAVVESDSYYILPPSSFGSLILAK